MIIATARQDQPVTAIAIVVALAAAVVFGIAAVNQHGAVQAVVTPSGVG